MKIILGSSSQWRKDVLKRAGIEFESISPDIDEKAIRRDDPKELVLAIAHAKADVLEKQITEPALLITSDQVTICHGEIREKPETEEEARRYLKSYEKYPAELINGLVVTNTKTGKRAEGIGTVKIFLKGFPDKVIDQIIAKGDGFTCSGGFQAEDPLTRRYIDRMEGTDEGAKGLPLDLLKRLMKEVQD
ncbi:Maf family protein [Patescibacteria group bacterium]|nr:Maf family protein [Patescibacteria group bacterium]